MQQRAASSIIGGSGQRHIDDVGAFQRQPACSYPLGPAIQPAASNRAELIGRSADLATSLAAAGARNRVRFAFTACLLAPPCPLVAAGSVAHNACSPRLLTTMLAGSRRSRRAIGSDLFLHARAFGDSSTVGGHSSRFSSALSSYAPFLTGVSLCHHVVPHVVTGDPAASRQDHSDLCYDRRSSKLAKTSRARCSRSAGCFVRAAARGNPGGSSLPRLRAASLPRIGSPQRRRRTSPHMRRPLAIAAV